MLYRFFLLSTARIIFLPLSVVNIERTLTITGSVCFPPSISTIVASFPWISNPWFPDLTFTPSNLTLADCEIIFGIDDSSFPQRTTLIALPSFPFSLILSAFPGLPREFVNSIPLIMPSIIPEITRSFCPSSSSLISFVMVSIVGISLSVFTGSIFEPEPMFIVGEPSRSDLTYALIILIKSPGFRFSIPGKFAFSSHNFTLAVVFASYTVIVLR